MTEFRAPKEPSGLNPDERRSRRKAVANAERIVKLSDACVEHLDILAQGHREVLAEVVSAFAQLRRLREGIFEDIEASDRDELQEKFGLDTDALQELKRELRANRQFCSEMIRQTDDEERWSEE